MDSAGGSETKAKAKPSVKKRPAMAIRSFPALSPVAKASPAKAPGGMWHGGPQVQKPWLKQVQKAHQLCRSSHNPGMESKAAGSSQQFKSCVPPPPMPEVLGSMSLMAQWHARWGDRYVNSKEWRSERNLVCIAGRPVGVLVVSHQRASPMEWDSYHNFTFEPLRPCVLFGPTGMSVQAPKMSPKFTVIEWWKDIMFFWSPVIKPNDVQARPSPPSASPPPPHRPHPRERWQPPLAPPRPLAEARTPPQPLHPGLLGPPSQPEQVAKTTY